MDQFKWILGLVTIVITYAKDLLPLPNYRDAVALRNWLTAVAGILDKAAAMTKIVLDDQAVAVLRAILADDGVYAAFHVMLVNLFTDGIEGTVMELAPGEIPEDVATFAAKAGFNPLLVIGIIQAVVAVIKLIKDLKTDEPVAA